MRLIATKKRCSSISWHFVGIELDQPQAAITDMVGLIHARADLDGSNQKIAGDHECKIALYGRLERSTDDSGVVDSRDRGGDVEFRIGIVEELNGNSGEGPGSCILENCKERKVQLDFSIAEHPWLLRCLRLGNRRRIQNGVP